MPFLSRLADVAIEPLTADDASTLAIMHAEDFPRPWGPEEFLALMQQDTVFGFAARVVARRGARPVGFILARLAAGEAEILTVAAARAYRRQGIGRGLMEAVLRRLHRDRAEALFLEVDEVNMAAIALYRRLGFREVGKRAGYYPKTGEAATGALVLRLDLR